MSSVFLDANVWLPAVLSNGFSRRLVRAAGKSGSVSVSAELIDEVVEKLALKFRVSWETIAEAKTLMTNAGRMVSEAVSPYAESPDPDDAILLAQALRARCSYFVTNDSRLLALGAVAGMPIITPREFAAIVGVR